VCACVLNKRAHADLEVQLPSSARCMVWSLASDDCGAMCASCADGAVWNFLCTAPPSSSPTPWRPAKQEQAATAAATAAAAAAAETSCSRAALLALCSRTSLSHFASIFHAASLPSSTIDGAARNQQRRACCPNMLCLLVGLQFVVRYRVCLCGVLFERVFGSWFCAEGR
jgi:hypothetical protein